MSTLDEALAKSKVVEIEGYKITVNKFKVSQFPQVKKEWEEIISCKSDDFIEQRFNECSNLSTLSTGFDIDKFSNISSSMMLFSEVISFNASFFFEIRTLENMRKQSSSSQKSQEKSKQKETHANQ